MTTVIRQALAVVFGVALLAPLQAQNAQQFRIEPQGEKNPWTHLQLKNDPDSFQFAILPDRTGGQRPQAFLKALDNLNLLNPEFVLSVGDMIEGYTTDTQALTRMWDDFTSTISLLKPPFFLVPGNHDLSNEVETQVWKERFGRTYYHFVYKDVLFLCLNSEDPHRGMGKEQVDYFARVLRENPNARWTLVFLHEPLWLDNEMCEWPGEYAKSNWCDFERLLEGRPYTVFAGHMHQYTESMRKGHKYFILSTSAGVSDLRGAANYGEFDHITWVTMTPEGPVLANVMSDGVRGEKIRSERVARLVTPLVWGTPVAGKPCVIDPAQPVEKVATQLCLKNGADIPLKYHIVFEPGAVLRPDANELDVVVAPKSEQLADVALQADSPIRASQLSTPVSYSWKACYEPAGEPKVEIEGKGSLAVDAKFECKKATKPVQVDGNVEEWPELALNCSAASDSSWHGPKDLSYRFATQYDDQYLYIAVQVKDDKTVFHPGKYPWQQDGVEIRIDAREEAQRSKGRGDNEMQDFLALLLTPGDGTQKQAVYMQDRVPPEVKIASITTEGGHTSEVAIPVAWLNAQQKQQWQGFRLNVAVDDCDETTAPGARMLWWRPDWRSAKSYEGSGSFVRK